MPTPHPPTAGLAVASHRRTFLGHMAAAGAAMAAAEVTGHDPLLTLGDRGVTVHAAGVDVAAAVRAHAARHATRTTWVWADWPGDGKALFAATRRSCPDWAALEAARRDATGGPMTALDVAMTTGIGWPMVWAGAERWSTNPLDCTPRNAGGNIIRTRLRPLAADVAAMTPAAIADDLAGDRPGRWETRWHPHSTTPARAWCAAWALAAFPVPEPTAEPLEVPAHAKPRPGREWVTLPAWDGPVRLSVWRSVVASRALLDAAFATCPQSAGWCLDPPSPLGQVFTAPDRPLAPERTAAERARAGQVLAAWGVPVGAHHQPGPGLASLRAWLHLAHLGVVGLLVWPIRQTTLAAQNVVREVLGSAVMPAPRYAVAAATHAG